MSMKQIKQYLIISFIISFFMTGCSNTNETKQKTQGSRDNTPIILIPEATGEKTIGNNKITFDLSNSQNGYTMVKYTGDNPKVKVRIQNPHTNNLYTYDLHNGYNIFPLTGGNGTYTFMAYENISGTKYSQLFSQKQDIQIKNDYISYLYPNQYVSFDEHTKAVDLAQDIVQNANTDLEAVNSIYEYVIHHISYDEKKQLLQKKVN